jgi:phosphatidate cytidylyltransferase
LLVTRIITAVVFGGAITAAVLLVPTWVAAALFGALWLAGAWEWTKLARLPYGRAIGYVAVVFASMLLALLAGPPELATVGMAAAAVFWLAAFFAVLSYPRSFSPPAVAISGFLVLVPSWLILVDLQAAEPRGRELAMTLFAIVWAADVGAYFAGRMLGRRKLAPKVSPGKTWEGVTGGAALAGVTGWGAAALLELPAGVLVALGVATALVSVVGDLTVSMFKRNVGLKDSGMLLPGHGGVMDRIDSLTAAVPIFALGLKAAGLIA